MDTESISLGHSEPKDRCSKCLVQLHLTLLLKDRILFLGEKGEDKWIDEEDYLSYPVDDIDKVIEKSDSPCPRNSGEPWRLKEDFLTIAFHSFVGRGGEWDDSNALEHEIAMGGLSILEGLELEAAIAKAVMPLLRKLQDKEERRLNGGPRDSSSKSMFFLSVPAVFSCHYYVTGGYYEWPEYEVDFDFLGLLDMNKIEVIKDEKNG